MSALLLVIRLLTLSRRHRPIRWVGVRRHDLFGSGRPRRLWLLHPIPRHVRGRGRRPVPDPRRRRRGLLLDQFGSRGAGRDPGYCEHSCPHARACVPPLPPIVIAMRLALQYLV